MAVAMKIEGLSKKYQVGRQREPGSEYVALRDVLADKAKLLLKPQMFLKRAKPQDFWALKDVNLEIEQGDKVAIIGHNGAGKSTLLKILSQITEPTEGRVELYGRVASLLEVGTGFHPELTGRENIYLNGSILGMSHAEVRRKFDEIVDFSGVKEFLDMPVKRYSSGMRMRLGFAVAAHLESEILIIDEVLAVGDAAFQKKCLGKMDEVSKSEGRTILFVSHNMGAVQQLCNRGILLNKGQMVYSGELAETVKLYIQSQLAATQLTRWQANAADLEKSSNDYLELLRVEFKDQQRKAAFSPFMNHQLPLVEFELRIKKPGADIGYILYDALGHAMYATSTLDCGEASNPMDDKTGTVTLTTQLPNRMLNEGLYSLKPFAFVRGRESFLHPARNTALPVLQFEIAGGLSDSPHFVLKREGLLAPLLKWI